MILLEGSVEPKSREEENRGGFREVRDQPKLGPTVSTPRVTVPGCRHRRAQICRDGWTETPDT